MNVNLKWILRHIGVCYFSEQYGLLHFLAIPVVWVGILRPHIKKNPPIEQLNSALNSEKERSFILRSLSQMSLTKVIYWAHEVYQVFFSQSKNIILQEGPGGSAKGALTVLELCLLSNLSSLNWCVVCRAAKSPDPKKNYQVITMFETTLMRTDVQNQHWGLIVGPPR